MTKPLSPFVAALTALLLASCTPAPAKKDGISPVTVPDGKDGGTAGRGHAGSGAAGSAAAGVGGSAALPDPSGEAGAGAAGLGGSGAAGTAAEGAGTAGTGTGGTGAAGTGAPDAGAAGTRAPADAGDAPAGDRPDAPPVVVDPCNRATWTFSSSVACAQAPCAGNAIDGNQATRYTTGFPQGSRGPESVTLTFRAPVTLTGVRLVSAGGDGPSIYRVDWSTDATTFWTFEPAAAGVGTDDLSVTFPAPKTLIAFRVNQIGLRPINWWSIHELSVLGCAKAP